MATSAGKHVGPKQPSLIASSAWMAAGTVVSRLTGFARAAIIAAALGLTLTADVFNVPNVIPNMLFILVGGGVLNSVLVPALVRSIKSDDDGGEAYSQRLFSVTVTVLGLATVLAVIAAPLLVRLIVSSAYLEPEMQPYFDNMVSFARFCLPQIFFYGVYVLIGQILNARGRFGPMMWSPILNNIISIAVFAAYLAMFGTKDTEPFTAGEVQLLGIGSTLAVAAQALALVPVLRRMGFSLRFRTDWRGHGLSEPIRLGAWSVGFVVVNQIAYLFFVSTATSASAAAAGTSDGAGYSVYANAMLIMMVPHAVVTVSLATALLPRLSDQISNGHIEDARTQLVSGVRASLAIIIPCAALMAILAGPLVALLFDYGSAAGETAALAATLIALTPGLVAFTVHYLCLRGFFALQDTRTPFFTQVWIAGTMVVWALGMSVIGPSPGTVTTLLAVGYTVAYLVGATLSVVRLQHELGQVDFGPIVSHIGRVLTAGAVAAGVAWFAHSWLSGLLDGLGVVGSVLDLGVCGMLGVLVFVGLAHAFGIDEVRDALALGRAKLRGPAEPPSAGYEELEETAEHPAPVPRSLSANLFRQPALAPNASMEFVLDETMHGATMHAVSSAVHEAAEGIGEGRRYRLTTLMSDVAGAQTWLGWDSLLRRQVFVLCVAAEDDRANALIQAAQRAASVTDPRFLRVLDLGVDEVAYVVEEFTPGDRLADVLTRGPLATADAQAIERDLDAAFASANAQGLYHQRLTPAHVYLAPGGALKISGLETEAALFGPARIDDADPATLDRIGVDRVADACYDGYLHSGVAVANSVDQVVPGLYENVGVRRSRREQHGRRAKRVAGVLVALVALVGVGAAGMRVLLQSIDSSAASSQTDDEPVADDPSAGPSEPPRTTTSPSPTPTPTGPPDPIALPIDGADFFDPEGQTPENPEQTGNAIDGDPSTVWNTLTYYDPLEQQKSGVGLYVDLGEPMAVQDVKVQLERGDTDVELRVLPGEGDIPDEIDGWERADSVEGAGQDVTFELDQPVTTRYVLVWFTRLPGSSQDYREAIAEVSVLGTPTDSAQ